MAGRWNILLLVFMIGSSFIQRKVNLKNLYSTETCVNEKRKTSTIRLAVKVVKYETCSRDGYHDMELYVMASVARLPSLQNVGGHVTQQVLSQIPSRPKFGGPTTKKKTSKSKLTVEKDGKKAKNKIDTQRHRNSYMHNLCLDMLKDGFHLSYCELFNLMKSERERRQKLIAESGAVDESFVEDQPEKLEQLKLNLTAAEAGARRGKMDVVYGCYLSLAVYFENLQETYLSNHFYKLCLDTSVKVRGDGRRKEAEANYNMGIADEKQGVFTEALSCFENFYNLTSGRLWQDDGTGRKLFSTACECLQRIYTTVARQLKESNPTESIGYLLKAYKVAKEGDDVPGRAEASYILGRAYQDFGDAETAMLYHNEYFNICQQVDDVTGMGRACRVLANSCKKQMDVEAAVKHLESFVELSERSGDFKEQQTACSSLGEMLNSLGKYEESATYYERAYKLSGKIEKDKKKELVRAEYGVVNANLVLHGLSQAMNTADTPGISELLNWKQSRKSLFSPNQQIPNILSQDTISNPEENTVTENETNS